MSVDKLSSIVNRLFFFVAFALLVLAVIEGILNLIGYTILQGQYTAGRLTEFAALLLVFVIALLLRQMREEGKKRSSSS